MIIITRRTATIEVIRNMKKIINNRRTITVTTITIIIAINKLGRIL